jgi:hypothetical protein
MVLLLVVGFQLSGQDNAKEEVMKVVNTVFEAMRTNDSTLLKLCFTKEVRMSTIFIDQNGVTQFREGTLQKFAEAVGAKKTDVYNEPIWNEKVQIDGSLAAVWVDYAFYLNTTFSHCGVDAFHLVNTSEGWKIFNLVDTRSKSDCEIPEKVKLQFGG